MLGIPALLVSTAVRAVALSEDFYLGEFTKYDVGRTTGLTASQLREVARGFIDYFQSAPTALRIEVSSADGPRALFNQREIVHMEDVHGIVRAVLGAWQGALVAIAAGSAILLATDRAGAPRQVARATAAGGATTVLLVGSLALGALIDFRQLFLQFHFISFANDLWILDPTRDRLIQLFPQGFFFDASLRIGVQTIVLGGAILLLSLAALWATARRERRRIEASKPA